MTNSAHPVFRAVSLVTLAALFTGCPAIEPDIPDPAPPTPVSGVWGLQVADVSSDGFCDDLGAVAIGRVILMDVAADPGGELALSFFGFDMYGGHADGRAWADAELSGFGFSGHYEPDIDYTGEEDGDLMEEEGDSGHSEGSEGSEGSESHGDPEEAGSPTVSCVSEESEPGEGREPHCDSPDPYMDPGLYVAFDADIINARTMDGVIELSVSNGYEACTFVADVNAAYLGEDVDFDLMDDGVPYVSTPTDHGQPKDVSTEPAE